MKTNLKRINTQTINDEENKSTNVVIDWEIDYSKRPCADALFQFIKQSTPLNELDGIHTSCSMDKDKLKFYFTTHYFVKVKNTEYNQNKLYRICMNGNFRRAMRIQNTINTLFFLKWKEYTDFLCDIMNFNDGKIAMKAAEFHRLYEHDKMTNK